MSLVVVVVVVVGCEEKLGKIFSSRQAARRHTDTHT